MALPEDHNRIIDELKQAIGEQNVMEPKIARHRRIFLTVPFDHLKDAILQLQKAGINHLSTISGVDTGDSLMAVYHFTRQGAGQGLTISIRVKATTENPKLPSITEIIPAATFYEREVHDLFGISFDGHPDLSKLELSDDWPEDLHPLLKKWKPEDIRKRLDQVG